MLTTAKGSLIPFNIIIIFLFLMFTPLYVYGQNVSNQRYNEFKNPEYHYKLQYPANWAPQNLTTIRELPELNTVQFGNSISSFFTFAVLNQSRNIEESVAYNLAHTLASTVKEMVPGAQIKVIENGSSVIDNVRVQKEIFSVVAPPGPQKNYDRTIFFISSTTAEPRFTVLAQAMSSDPASAAVIQKMIDSIRFEKSAP